MLNDTQKALNTISFYDMFKFKSLDDPKFQKGLAWVTLSVAYLPVPLALLIAFVF